MLSSSLGTSARGTRGPAPGRLRDSRDEGWALGANSAAAHGSGQPSWASRAEYRAAEAGGCTLSSVS